MESNENQGQEAMDVDLWQKKRSDGLNLSDNELFLTSSRIDGVRHPAIGGMSKPR
jgi:hypothetical protein